MLAYELTKASLFVNIKRSGGGTFDPLKDHGRRCRSRGQNQGRKSVSVVQLLQRAQAAIRVAVEHLADLHRDAQPGARCSDPGLAGAPPKNVQAGFQPLRNLPGAPPVVPGAGGEPEHQRDA